jgi:hypothetical protein
MVNKFIHTILLVFTIALSYSQTNIKIEPSTSTPRKGEPFLLKVFVESDCSAPKLNFEGAIQVGTSSYSPFSSIINGKTSSSSYYEFQYIPMQTGPITIHNVDIKCKKQSINFSSITLNVLPERENQNIYIEAKLNKKEIYPGEDVEYTLNIIDNYGYRVDIEVLSTFFQNNKHWDIEDITIKNSDKKYAGTFRLKNKTGSTKLPNIAVLIYTNGRKGLIITKEKSINLVKLPQPEPDNFFGLIGQYSISDSISHKEINMSTGTSVNISITGNGNLDGIETPDLDLNDWYINSKPALYNTYNYGGNVYSEANMQFDIIPGKSGRLSFPSIELVYFDPKSYSYKTLKTKSYEFEVKQQQAIVTEINKDKESVISNDPKHSLKWVKLFPELLVFIGLIALASTIALRLKLRANKLKPYLFKKSRFSRMSQKNKVQYVQEMAYSALTPSEARPLLQELLKQLEFQEYGDSSEDISSTVDSIVQKYKEIKI